MPAPTVFEFDAENLKIQCRLSDGTTVEVFAVTSPDRHEVFRGTQVEAATVPYGLLVTVKWDGGSEAFEERLSLLLPLIELADGESAEVSAHMVKSGLRRQPNGHKQLSEHAVTRIGGLAL